MSDKLLSATELADLAAKCDRHGASGAAPCLWINWPQTLAFVCRQALAQAAEIERLSLESGQLRTLCLQLEVDRDERDAYRQDLEEIGRLIGCGHIEDGLARCVRDALAKAEGKPCP